MSASKTDASPCSEPIAQDSPPSGWESKLWLIFGVAAIALLLICYWVPQYREDEYITVLRTQLSWPDLWTRIQIDPGPAPYYALMKPWSMVSINPIWMRIPEIVAMGGAVAIAVGFVRRAVGTRDAIFTGIALLALPAISRWGMDVRPYAFATLCSVAAAWFWWRYLQDYQKRWAIGYGAAVVGMGAFHLYTLTLLPTLLLMAFLLPGERKRQVIATIVPAAVAGVVLLPMFYLNLAHPTGTPANPSALSAATYAHILRETIGWPVAIAFVMVIGIGSIYVALRSEKRRPVIILAIAWPVLALIELIVVHGVTGVPTLATRYFIFCVPAIGIMIGVTLGYFARRCFAPAIAALTVLAILGLGDQITYRSFLGHDPHENAIAYRFKGPALAGFPILGQNLQADLFVDRAFFPQKVLTGRKAAPQPVAIVMQQVGVQIDPDLRPIYTRPNSGWDPFVTCPLTSTREFVIYANAQGRAELGDPNAFLAKVNADIRPEEMNEDCYLN